MVPRSARDESLETGKSFLLGVEGEPASQQPRGTPFSRQFCPQAVFFGAPELKVSLTSGLFLSAWPN